MGFAVPPAVANLNATQPGPLRRTPNSGTAPVRSSSKTLTSGVVPPPNFDGTVVPTTSPIGALPKDTMLAPGGEPQARGYYHASQATRTLIGGSVPAPSNLSGPPSGTKRATAPGFPTLPDPSVRSDARLDMRLDKSTLVGVAVSPALTSQAPAATSQHPTHRSPITDTAVSTERDLRAVIAPNEAVSAAEQGQPPPYAGATSHLGRFRIQKRLGAGGVGAVYLASKVDAAGSGNQLLAVKVLREHFYRDPSTLKALFREARLAARMDHRHIVRVFDIGYHNKHPYLVMEYVDGLSLAALLNHDVELPLGIGVRCLIDALHGLDFAHKLRGDEGEPLGLVHCDVSPQNILVGVDGVAKVTDFGVARTREEDGDEFVLRCKPEFAAPELLQEEPVRPETDVFSAGAVLYRIATGALPFPGETEDEIIEKLRNTDPVPPSHVKESLPQFLDAFCAQAMAKSVGDRFRTCLDMARSLERQAEAAGLLADRLTVGTWVQSVRRAMEQGDVAPHPVRRSIAPSEGELNGAVPTRREPRNNKTVMVAAAVALVLAVGAVWWWLGTADSAGDSTGESAASAAGEQLPPTRSEVAAPNSAAPALAQQVNTSPQSAASAPAPSQAAVAKAVLAPTAALPAASGASAGQGAATVTPRATTPKVAPFVASPSPAPKPVPASPTTWTASARPLSAAAPVAPTKPTSPPVPRSTAAETAPPPTVGTRGF